MSVQEVKAVILKVQPHIAAFDPGRGRDLNPAAPANNHETSTRYIIIDPVLRALGWDLSDPKDCIVEYKVSPRSMSSVDYALLDDRGNPAVLVEAKRIDVDTNDWENWEQIHGYADEVQSARVVAVTNGQYWAIQVRVRNGTWQPESERPLGLHWQDVGENAERLYRHLDRSRHR